MSASAARPYIVDAEAVIRELIEQGGVDQHVIEALDVAIILLEQALAELRQKKQPRAIRQKAQP